jgi:hypothetical protein
MIAQHLDRPETVEWIAHEFRAGRTVLIVTNRNRGLCCDIPYTALEFRSDETIHAVEEGFAPTAITVAYDVNSNGTIEILLITSWRDPTIIPGLIVAIIRCLR